MTAALQTACWARAHNKASMITCITQQAAHMHINRSQAHTTHKSLLKRKAMSRRKQGLGSLYVHGITQ